MGNSREGGGVGEDVVSQGEGCWVLDEVFYLRHVIR